MGLTPRYSSKADRFEVDGANSAQAFLRQHNISEQDIYTVWTAIALHTTPGIPQYMHPVVALVTAGVEMDVLGIEYVDFSDADREAVIRAYPRSAYFKEDIIRATTDDLRQRQGRCLGGQRSQLSKGKLLRDNPPFRLARLRICAHFQEKRKCRKRHTSRKRIGRPLTSTLLI
jgi:hypothetical protein